MVVPVVCALLLYRYIKTKRFEVHWDQSALRFSRNLFFPQTQIIPTSDIQSVHLYTGGLHDSAVLVLRGKKFGRKTLHAHEFDKWDNFRKLSEHLSSLSVFNRHETALKTYPGWHPVVSVALITIMLLVFLCQIFYRNPYGNDIYELIIFGGITDDWWKSGEIYRLFTAPLIHLNGWYLGTNIVVLLVIGTWVEKIAGRVIMLFCCLAGTVGAALFFSIFSSYQYVVGSSSLIFALLGFSGFIQIFCREKLPLIYQIEIIDLYAIGASMVLLHALLYWIDAPVSISAHTGAFCGGLVVGIGVVSRFKVKLA